MVAFAGGMGKPFPRYWLSGFLADFGDGVRLAAFPLLAAQLTRSPAAVAAVATVQGVPWLLLGGGLGVIVDRVDRRRLMAVVDVTRGAMIAALAALILAHGAGLALIYATAFVTGAGSALRDTAAATCVPRLVAQDGLEKANGRVIAGQVVGNELAGPRQLYFVIESLLARLRYLKPGLAVILAFIGVKLLLEAMWDTPMRHLGSWQIPRVSTHVSLFVILGVLVTVAVASAAADRVGARRARDSGQAAGDGVPRGDRDVTV